MTYDVNIDGKDYRLELSQAGGILQCKLDGREIRMDASLIRPDVLSILIENQAYEIKRASGFGGIHLWVGSGRYAVEVRDPRSIRGRKAAGASDAGPRKLVASMPGKVVRILVREKMDVEAGQGILVVEAMKMQNEIKSPKKGVLQKIVAAEGTTVNAGDVLAIVE
jgi:acetyl/propionyl-CoA carboxylase alpha subunit